MVKSAFHSDFQKAFSKIKDRSLKEKLWKQVEKVRDNPEIGKPMRFNRKGTRELYVKPYRLSYMYIEKENKILVLDAYHKDIQ